MSTASLEILNTKMKKLPYFHKNSLFMDDCKSNSIKAENGHEHEDANTGTKRKAVNELLLKWRKLKNLPDLKKGDVNKVSHMEGGNISHRLQYLTDEENCSNDQICRSNLTPRKMVIEINNRDHNKHYLDIKTLQEFYEYCDNSAGLINELNIKPEYSKKSWTSDAENKYSIQQHNSADMRNELLCSDLLYKLHRFKMNAGANSDDCLPVITTEPLVSSGWFSSYDMAQFQFIQPNQTVFKRKGLYSSSFPITTVLKAANYSVKNQSLYCRGTENADSPEETFSKSSKSAKKYQVHSFIPESLKNEEIMEKSKSPDISVDDLMLIKSFNSRGKPLSRPKIKENTFFKKRVKTGSNKSADHLEFVQLCSSLSSTAIDTYQNGKKKIMRSNSSPVDCRPYSIVLQSPDKFQEETCYAPPPTSFSLHVESNLDGEFETSEKATSRKSVEFNDPIIYVPSPAYNYGNDSRASFVDFSDLRGETSAGVKIFRLSKARNRPQEMKYGHTSNNIHLFRSSNYRLNNHKNNYRNENLRSLKIEGVSKAASKSMDHSRKSSISAQRPNQLSKKASINHHNGIRHEETNNQTFSNDIHISLPMTKSD